MKSINIIISIVLSLLFIAEMSGSVLNENIVANESIPHDTTDLKFLFQVQDSSNISEDSLEKIVPYLDEVEADSKNELLVIYMLLIAFSTFFSEDLAAIGAGLMVANGMITFWPAAIAVIAGIFTGDFTLYLAGRWLGRPVLKIPPFKWFIHEDSIEVSVRWFDIKGPYILFASRFIPGSRMPVYLTAGILETRFWKFLLYFGGTVLLWTPIFVWLSVLAGNEILTIYETYDDYAVWIILGIVILFIGLYKIVPLVLTTRGRRLLRKKILTIFNNRAS